MNRLSLVRVGAFSGSGLSLRNALSSRVEVADFDLMSVVRTPSFWPRRVLAVQEAARAGRDVPFSKTAAWSRGLQRAIPPRLLDDPVLFVQTTTAVVLPSSVRYGIYTDRLGREGMNAPDFPSQASPGWVEREQEFVAGADRLFVMGPTTRDYAVSHYGLPGDRVVVVGGAPNAALGSHRRSRRCRRLLFVGVDWQRKGLVDLLEAFAVVREEQPELALEVVGGHPPGPAPPGVTYSGRVPHDDMARHFGEADLLVIPTHAEPFGIALVEALMMGIPVIGTDVGNQSWIIGNGGLTVAPGRPDELATAIRRVIDDYPAMKTHADERRDELLATMTWDRIAERILAELVGGDLP